MCGRRKELVPLADRFTKKLIGEEFGRLGCSMVEIKMIAMKSTSAKGSYLKRIVMLPQCVLNALSSPHCFAQDL